MKLCWRAFALLSFLFPLLASAHIASVKSIDVYLENLPPYQIVTDESITGYTVDVVNHLAKEAGFEVHLIPLIGREDTN